MGCDEIFLAMRTQAAEIKTRKLCAQALETCRQEREREQAERESERERERAAMEQSTREVGEKAIKFVASEILRLNESFLQLGEPLFHVSRIFAYPREHEKMPLSAPPNLTCRLDFHCCHDCGHDCFCAETKLREAETQRDHAVRHADVII